MRRRSHDRARNAGRNVIDPELIRLLLVAIVALEGYLLLPPGIPFVTSFGLVPLRLWFTNLALVGLVAYGLYVFGFTIIESLALASIWMSVAVYLVIDYLYNVPLTL